MSEKNTRGRASKVDLLPPNIKTQLAMMLRDKQYSQSQILEEINDLIRDCGLPDEMLLSKTGLNRYASRMERLGQKSVMPGKLPKFGLSNSAKCHKPILAKP